MAIDSRVFQLILFGFGLFAFTLINQVACDVGQRLIQTLADDLGAENFTYYRLQRPGLLRLDLQSLLGDVDMYVSTEHQHPSFYRYDLKSETCGLDVVTISPLMARPVYISLFGHPNYLFSRYSLSIFEVEEEVQEDYESLVSKYERYSYFGESESESEDGEQSSSYKRSQQSKSQTARSPSLDQDDEEELPLWTKILLGFLRFVVEIIL